MSQLAYRELWALVERKMEHNNVQVMATCFPHAKIQIKSVRAMSSPKSRSPQLVSDNNSISSPDIAPTRRRSRPVVRRHKQAFVPVPVPSTKRAKNKLYVANLGMHITEEQLREEFGRYGSVNHVWISRLLDELTGMKFAHVTFDDSRDAEDAMRGLDGHNFGGRDVNVSFVASPK